MPHIIITNPPRSSLWRAECRLCSWRGRNYIGRDAAEGNGREHWRAKHMTALDVRDGIVFARIDGHLIVGVDPAQKGTTMRKRADIEAEAKQLERRLSSLVDELAQIDSLPSEPLEDNTVVTFEIRYNSHDHQTYTYAALKAKGAWWLTGREKGGRSWEELLEFMSQDHRISEDGAPIVFQEFHPADGKTITQVIPGL